MKPCNLKRSNNKPPPAMGFKIEPPSDPNMASILIPDDAVKFMTLSCSFCGMGIEMTDDLLNELISSQQKKTIELLRERVQAHFDDIKTKQNVACIQCELIREPIQLNKPTE